MNSLLADIDPLDELKLTSTRTSPELYWVVAAIGVIVLLVIAWVVISRRKREDVSGWGPSHSHYRPPDPSAPEPPSPRKHHRRRRRRKHRPRNPTLAETGGLPPARADQSSGAED